SLPVEGVYSRVLHMIVRRRSGSGFMSAFQVSQRFPELVPGAVYVGLHGTQRQIERGRDLLVRAVFHVTKQNAGPILGAQLRDGLLDGAAQLLRLELVERRLAARAHVERGGLLLRG